MPHRAARWIRRISKRWQRNSQLVEHRAIDYARGRGFRYVTCGHTHLALEAEHDGVRYINSGTWTDYPPCPFVVVQGADVRLEHWPRPEAVVEPVAQEEAQAMPPSLPALG
jgi:UDP-2,3-diacylglucosamine pyrophosphatase LpxH